MLRCGQVVTLGCSDTIRLIPNGWMVAQRLQLHRTVQSQELRQLARSRENVTVPDSSWLVALAVVARVDDPSSRADSIFLGAYEAKVIVAQLGAGRIVVRVAPRADQIVVVIIVAIRMTTS